MRLTLQTHTLTISEQRPAPTSSLYLYLANILNIYSGTDLTLQGQQSHRMVIFAAILILMTLFILYSSNNNNIDAIYAPFHVVTNHAIKITDLRKWTGREGYVPVYGNKVGCTQIPKYSFACKMLCFNLNTHEGLDMQGRHGASNADNIDLRFKI